MHPGRRNILIRWVGYGLVVAGTVAWLASKDHQVPQFKSIVMAKLAPQQVAVPTDEATDAIRAAIEVLRGTKATYAKVGKVEPSLLVLEADVARTTGPRALMLSAISIGPKERSVVLSGVVYREGDILPDGRIIKAIEPDAVVFALGQNEERQQWQPPFRVELKRPKKEEQEKSFDPTETVAEKPATEPVKGGLDAGQLPPDLTPDQALQILQQLGKQ